MMKRSWFVITLALSSAMMLEAGFYCGNAVGDDSPDAVSDSSPNVDRQVELLTVTDPDLELKGIKLGWAGDIRQVWAAALRHTESDLRRELADSIVQANRAGMPGLEDLSDELLGVLQTIDERIDTRTAAAAALIDLDRSDLAEDLAAAAADGSLSLQRVIEPALARWDYAPAREIWLERLAEPSHPELLRLAVEGLGEVHDARAIGPLSEILHSPHQDAASRLTAARALARLNPPDTLRWAGRWLDQGDVAGDSGMAAKRFATRLKRQLAVELLVQQSSPEALRLLEIAADSEFPTVAGVALRRLLELDRDSVVGRAERMIGDRDANIRQVILLALADEPTPAAIGWLIRALDDSVPDLRQQARRSLLKHAADDRLREVVVDQAAVTLDGESWRSLEQAMIVLTELRHRAIKRRLVELIDHRRDEVQVTAGWAIKHLFEPDDAAEVLELARRVTAEIDSGSVASIRSDVQAHLFEALGKLNHRPAVEDLKGLIRKDSPYAVESRAAAIWALGFLLQAPADATLIRSLEARLADVESVPPEYDEVRAAAAIALGRIADPDSLPELRAWYRSDGPNRLVGRSSGWSVMRLTGEQLPPAEPLLGTVSNWVIDPLDSE